MNLRHARPEDLRGLKWRGYVRESTQAQADRGTPIDRQRADIERAATELGMIPAAPVWYERVGSGEAETVPELQRALDDGRRGQYQVLVVFHSSRWARNRYEAITMKRAFAAAGLVLYFASQRLISGTYAGALSEGISEVIDEHSNEERRMFIAGGQRERMLSGRWVGAIPFGYGKALVDFPDGSRGWAGGLAADDRAVTVRRIFADFAGGSVPLDLAYTLNAEGVPGPQGPWSRAAVVKLLRNPVYKGVLVRYRHVRPSLHYYPEADPQDGRREIAGAIEPIIGGAEWDQVQVLLDARVVTQQARQNRRSYPLSLILRCADCGRGMSGVSNGYSRYYRCSARAGDRSCSAPFIRADDAEGAFAEWLGSLTLPADWRAEIAATHAPDTGADERRRRLTDRLARLRKLYGWGELPEDEYRAEVARVRSDLSELVEPDETGMDALADRLRDLGRGWADAAPAQQTAVARLMLREIVVRTSAVIAFVARAEVRPLLELCLRERVADGGDLYADNRRSTANAELRWSA